MTLEIPSIGFDTSINEPLVSAKSDGITSAIASLMTPAGITATAVDVAASIWNTLPGDEVDVEDWLARVNGDALKVYQERPDTINTASLIAGSFIPGGAALKGMNAVRNGSKAANWFTHAGKQSDIARAAELVANAGKNTTEYKKLLWGMRGKTVANNFVDAAAAELAILGTLGAHPYMEDYNEDFAKNFGLSLMVGGALGSGVGIITDGFARRSATEAVERGVLGTVLEAITPAAPSMPDAGKLIAFQRSISSLDEIIQARKAAGKVETDDLLYSTAAAFQRQYQKEQLEVFDKMVDGGIKNWPAQEQQRLMDAILDNPGFVGVDSIRQKEAKEVLGRGRINNIFSSTPTLKGTNAAGAPVSKEAVYLPETGKFGSVKDIDHHAGLAALHLDEKGLLSRVPDKVSRAPNHDASFDLVGKSTPAVDADFGAWTLKFSKMEDEAFEKYLKDVKLSPEDVPQMQAIVTRMKQSNVMRNTGKVFVADDSAYAASKANAILEEEDIRRTLGGTPVRYQEAAEKLLNNQSVRGKYTVEGLEGISGWIAGRGVMDMQKGAVAYFAKGYARQGLTAADKQAAAKFENIYMSSQSQQLRADLLANLADKDGKIYLYRGINAPKIFGQAPLESMAVTPAKAGQFAKGDNAKTMLYKIDVDDVVGALVDIGPTGDNVEIIVRASAREAEAVLSPNGQIAFRKAMEKNLASATPAGKEARFGDLEDYLYDKKYALLHSLINKGYPVESIAKRTNMPIESVERFMASGRSFEEFREMGNIYAYQNTTDVLAANAEHLRPLVVKGSLKKADYTVHAANLNARNIDSINKMWVGNVVFKSESRTVRDLGAALIDDYGPALDIARQHLARINNEAAGNRFFSDTVQFTRMMGELGPIFSAVGKRVQDIANKASAAVVKPIGEFMAPVSSDIAALTEFSVAHNLNAAQKGYRIYKDRQFWKRVEDFDEHGKPIVRLEAITLNGKEFKVQKDSVDQLLTQMQNSSKELYHLANAPARITGSNNVNDIGFWMPSWNPIDKHVAYVHDAATDTTRVLYGKSPNELEDAIKAFSSDLKDNPNLRIVRKGDDQQLWSKLNGRLDAVRMERADLSKQKTGSGATAIPRISTDVLAEVAGGYEHYINAHTRNLADLMMDDITDALSKMSSVNQSGFKGQTLSDVKRAVQQPKDAARSMKNLLLGNPSLGEYEGWKTLNRSFESALSFGSTAISSVWNMVAAPVLKNPLRKGVAPSAEDLRKIDYEKFAQELEKAGVLNPFADLDKAVAIEKFSVSTLTEAPDVSKRLITASNALAATVVLRFGELAHPLVNLVSLPILTALANTRHMPETFMNASRATAEVSTAQVMYDGVRAMNSDNFKHLRKMWEDRGYFTPLVSEASDVLRASRSFEKGPIAAIENAVDSNLVQWMSKPADSSEALSRRYMMHTGYLLGKRLYPQLGDEGLTIFARDFMDKALGNYSASQRPVFFQGTMGMAMGLFQTYMLTMAQNIYRNIEMRDWKTLAKGMLAQQTIFGFASMPGFDQVSKAIGEHFSDDNVDLTTGVYRALEDPEASWFLYGAPSNILGASIYTRGDIAPRFPNVALGVDQLPAANFAVQSIQLVKDVASAASTMDASTGQAMLQALSLQTMNRPMARMSEIASAAIYEGGSMTRGGLTVQNAEEVLTLNGIMARVLATRPIEEQRIRQAEHLRSFYGAADRENRQAAINSIRTAIRAGKLDQEKVEAAAEKYFRNNGTPTGWNSAFNEAIARTPMSGTEQLLDRLHDDDPLHFMINSLH